MKIGRALIDGAVQLVRIEEDEAVLLYRESDHPAADALREALAACVHLDGDGARRPFRDIQLLSPISNPSKFLGVGLNYREHALEAGLEVPERPTLFVKTTNTIIGPTDDIVYRATTSDRVDYEVELAIVIGTRATCVDVDDADSVILGYTVCNDVTARDVQISDGQWVRGKSFDTFAPLGPVIVTADELGSGPLQLRTTLNGDVVQNGSTDDMIFNPCEIVSYVSACITLVPGDLITTGTPAGVGFARTPPLLLRDGDRVTVEIQGIGACHNHVRVT
jgi:2-keto-4-pentenoate hydratase/2-oxohepta-3-ene-1,7-dioic acid hydratase in catechol pathway